MPTWPAVWKGACWPLGCDRAWLPVRPCPGCRFRGSWLGCCWLPQTPNRPTTCSNTPCSVCSMPGRRCARPAGRGGPALAQEGRPTLVLLGRSPEPGPEPAWLAELAGEVEIKRELARRGAGSLKEVGEQCRLLLAEREVRRTLARIESTGAPVVYR